MTKQSNDRNPYHLPDGTVSRRQALKASGLAGIGIALAQSHQAQAAHDVPGSEHDAAAVTVPFFGRNQAGISTASQKHLHFAAFDLLITERAQLQDLLRLWSKAAARMSVGLSVDEQEAHLLLPPLDTGETVGHSPANLTVTFGFGPTLFERDGVDRFGLLSQRPAVLQDIPAMPGDQLEPQRSGGDICVQACADDPQVAFHAVRNLTRLAAGLVVMRWSQLGFAPAANTSRTQQTPRNLFGFKDGTNNVKAQDEAVMAEHVWVGAEDEPTWMRDGTYLVARRIRMLIETWDNTSLDAQEKSIGRHKVSGAPLGAKKEHDPLTLDVQTESGQPIIPQRAHVRIARGDGAQQMLRRGYSYTDGMDAATGQLDAGLFFISFQRDPLAQFVPMQQRLAENDALNEYTTHTGSAVFACPPGAPEGGYVGQTLFEMNR